MKNKPDLSFWRLWDLSFGFFGVQIAYSLQTANVSRIFTTIGADPHDLSYFWILPPLMGLIVQPLVGLYSDKTWNRFGRRLPYLMFGATIAVIVMCMLPNAGSLHFSIANAILFGLVSLMLLDTSINMAMQPFKMLVGDMVNEKQKSKAYSIQSFLCNAGSIIGYALPFCLVWLGLQTTAPSGEVPQTVVWSFYIGAIVLAICVIYSLIKIKEWPPKIYNEYNGIVEKTEKKSTPNLFKLLIHAPSTFWTVGLVQFFCWFAFLFLWTYTSGTVAYKAFNTPLTTSVNGISYNGNNIDGKYVLINDTIIINHGTALAKGVFVNNKLYPASTVVINNNDTIVKNNQIVLDEDSKTKAEFDQPIQNVNTLSLDGVIIEINDKPIIKDYLSTMSGPATITTASIYKKGVNGNVEMEDAKSTKVDNLADCKYNSSVVLNASSRQYNEAGNWVGLLYAVQALGSVAWALILPRFKSRKLSYSLSLLLGAIGFILLSCLTNPMLQFIAFLLIGIAWSAILAWPFTILTNSLHSGNIGSYLGLFNCTICLPQIIAAITGGWILTLLSTPGQIAPEYKMIFIGGIVLALGAVSVFLIKEGNNNSEPQEDIVDSEML